MDDNDDALDDPGVEQAEPTGAAVNRRLIDDWFFNHFHQSAIVTQPHVFRLARAAKEDLLQLLGIE